MLTRNKIVCIGGLLIFLIGCKAKENHQNLDAEIINTSIIDSIFYNNSKIIVSRFHNELLDTLKNWQKFKVVPALVKYDWSLDSLHCINKKGNKVVSAILIIDNVNEDATLDYIYYFYNVKINTKWYSFNGPNVVVPRAAYGNPKNKPLTFPQLHAIAMKEVFRGYLKKNAKGEWEINEAFFERIEFQHQKWGYWDDKGQLIDNSKLSNEDLQKLYLKRIIYDKYK